MFKSFMAMASAALANIGHALAGAFQSVQPEAVEAFDNLVEKYAPIAINQVKAAATDPGLLSNPEKRSAVFDGLAKALVADGHDAQAEGFTSFVNLLVEVGVNAVKMIEGKSLIAPPVAAKD